MADNFDYTPGTGETGAADDIGGVKFPRIKLIYGADGVNAGDVAANNPLPVVVSGGTTAITGTVTVTGSTSVINTVTVTGSTAVVGTVTVTGSTAVVGVVTVTGSTAVIGTVTVTGSTALVGTATVVQATAANLNCVVSNGTIGINNTVTITGSTAVINTVTVTGSTAIIGTVTVTGSTAVIGTVTVTGSTAIVAALPAGTNNIGDVDVLSFASGKTIKRAVISCPTSGNNTIVAAVADKKIKVLSVCLVAAAAVTVRFESGADGTALTGVMSLDAKSGFVLNAPADPNCHWFETGVNTLLNLELGGAVQVSGMLAYYEEA
jgi:hypothetical protein